ncbi:MAG: plastocyanin/azurin family copper-binding protein [Actinomycetota bacterium]|nr:plastocyanin/azurin family copper-binding protein [Actinomycetota bacterium]
MILRRTTLPVLAIALAVGSLIVPAGAVHLFPLVPGDPFGDCGSTLQPDPGTSAGHVGVEHFSFMDHSSGSSRTQVKAGDSVTWVWGVPYCHSVTFQSNEVQSTDGGEPGGFDGSEPQLTKPEGSNNTFTTTFDQPGTYDYVCVHHASMGMTGQVVVS